MMIVDDIKLIPYTRTKRGQAGLDRATSHREHPAIKPTRLTHNMFYHEHKNYCSGPGKETEKRDGHDQIDQQAPRWVTILP